MKPQTNAFIGQLSELDKRYHTKRWSNIEPRLCTSVAEYITSLSDSDLKSLVSDKHWNSYPTFVYYNGNEQSYMSNTRRFYSVIAHAVKFVVYSNSKLKNLLIKNSDGIFRMATINACLGKDKIKASRFGLKSNDTRVRKLAVTLLPIRDVEEHLKTEKSNDIKYRIEKRIGYLNMLNYEINSPYRYIRSRAIANSDFDPEMIREIVKKKKEGNGNKFYDTDVLASVVYNVDSASAAFYLDIFREFSDADPMLKKAFLSKLSGKIHE